jgi:membrane protein
MFRTLSRTARRAATTWVDHEGTRLAASLSLYSLLSLAPLVILSVAIASLVFDRSAAQQALLREFAGMIGPDGAHTIEAVLQYGKTPSVGGWASVLGIVTLLLGASSVFGELQSALNKIWEVESSRTGGILAFAKSRLFSFAMVLAIGFLLLISLVFSTAVTTFSDYFSAYLLIPKTLLQITNAVLSLIGIVLLLALIMKYVPDTRIRWSDVWQGAIATALLFTLGKALLGLYLGKAAVGSAYGAAGSLIVVIVWVYYSAMIFYFGAEFTRACAQERQRMAANRRSSSL